MSKEYRPRLRASRKNPVSRKGSVVIAVCKDSDDATAIELLLKGLFAAAQKIEMEPQAEAPLQIHNFDPVAVASGTTAPLES